MGKGKRVKKKKEDAEKSSAKSSSEDSLSHKLSSSRKKRKKAIIAVNVFMAFIVMLLGLSQYKISQYNSDLNKLKERIDGKILSGIFYNFKITNMNLRNQDYNYFLDHGKPKSAHEMEDDILTDQKESIILNLKTYNIYQNTDLLDKVKKEIQGIIDNSEMTFIDKHHKLKAVSAKYMGLADSYLDQEYSKRQSLQKKLGIASSIQITMIILLFILTSLSSYLSYKTE